MTRALVAGLLITLGACDAVGTSTVQGSGTAATESRAVDDFTAIAVGGALALHVHVGPAPAVEVRGDDNIVPLIRTEVRDGTLHVESRRAYTARTPLVVDVATPAVTGLDASGAITASIEGVTGDAFRIAGGGATDLDVTAEVAHLVASIAGSGSLRLAGRADDLRLDVSGAGDVHARGAAARTATVTISGAGAVEVTVADTLDATISGSATVDYWGQPARVERHVAGAGAIRAH
ncbi:MAG: DUF2807 domain-containing protein [Kofleriaceae bacterium]|nr:DUF2807 domain-containing protein [Myxococcales bacterium]MCB9561993.1 DUF2807 domain-containing protein [Kofleriaceae bacterium]MCB9573161.1 DUF2807 domain-containing protein [Kofleriaceae bacterium]